MSALLSSHLEQISLCAQSISELPFPGPRRFTNAILANHDITALLRDTQAHERALFHLAPPEELSKPTAVAPGPTASAPTARTKRKTVYDTRQPKNRAVAAILGGDLYEKIHQQPDDRGRGQVDVESLLQGAEKLANVYPMAGAAERIAQLRRRHRQLEANLTHYESRIEEQRQELDKMNVVAGSVDIETVVDDPDKMAEITTTKTEDLQTTQDEINELEQKKQSLERRVHGMERDLGGLMR